MAERRDGSEPGWKGKAGGTVEDFGAQWLRFRENRGYYASVDLLRDICEPLLPLAELADREVLEIGSGTGRIADMLLRAGARRVIAVEPSAAVEVLRRNLRSHGDRVEVIHATGEEIPQLEVDLVLSVGVIHHIPDPQPTLRRAFEILRPGGRILIWVYGEEGNELYLAILRPLRALTVRLPDRVLAGLSHVLNLFLTPYVWACGWLSLPLSGYLRKVLGRFGWRERSLVIFDQLNPGHARYYPGDEAEELLHEAGFREVRRHHRHGYSWTVIGEKPARDRQ